MTWKLKGQNACADLAQGVMSAVSDVAKHNFPELADLLPFRFTIGFKAHFASGWLAILVDDRPPIAASLVGGIWNSDDPKLAELKARVEPYKQRNHDELRSAVGDGWFSSTQFLYVGAYVEEAGDYIDLQRHVGGWLINFVLPSVLELNRTRVLRAIPTPPSYDVGRIARSLLVIESSKAQGTAFAADGLGVITCDHVLGSGDDHSIFAFRSENRDNRFQVSVLKRNATLDLAIVHIDGANIDPLPLGTADNLKIMDHILVAGFPNQNFGDTGFFVPGVIVGFRVRHGVRRVMTNAPIVSGASGSPVIDGNNKVVGVAVTGAQSFGGAHETEDHGIIPIDAVKLL